MKALNDFISSLNWGIQNKKLYVKVKKTKFILNLICVLIQENYLLGVKDMNKNFILVFLKFDIKKTASLITKLVSFSKSSRHFYVKASLIKKLTGFFVLSTIEGVLSNKEAKRRNLGGKLLFKIR